MRYPDKERRAVRKEKKKQLAAFKASQATIAAINDRITTANGRLQDAKTKCKEIVDPAQAELMECEALESECVLTGKPIKEEIFQRRTVAIKAIEEAENRFRLEEEAIKRVIAQLESQRRSKSVDKEIAAIVAELTGVLANPEFMLERFSATERVTWADKRVKAAKAEYQKAQEAVDSNERERNGKAPHEANQDFVNKLQLAADEWRTELHLAKSALDDAVKYRQGIRDKILAE